MSLLAVGSVAMDTIETPFGRVDNVLGGSATYIATAASYFVAPIRLVGVVGGDFPREYIDFLESREIDLEGLQVVKSGKTFRWGGRYQYDLNTRETLFTELNVFEHFNPVIPPAFRKSSSASARASFSSTMRQNRSHSPRRFARRPSGGVPSAARWT